MKCGVTTETLSEYELFLAWISLLFAGSLDSSTTLGK